MSLVVVITSILSIDLQKISFKYIIEYIGVVTILLLIINFFTWLLHFLIDKGLNWLEKRKKRRYSLSTWLGDTNVSLELYNELESVKSFNPTNFHENYELAKQKILKCYSTVDELRGLKHHLEIQTSSQKYTSIYNSTQTILLGLIIPILLTIFNFKNFTSMSSSYNSVLFLIIWLGLLNIIDFMANQIDKKKVLLRLVNECIDEIN